MSALLDFQYALMTTSRLEQCVQVRDRLFNSRCPICGDSDKHKKKKRFYIYQSTKGGLKDYLSVACHNCGYGNPFGKFLEEFDQGLYAEYRLELFKEMGWSQKRPPPAEELVAPVVEKVKVDALNLPTISELDDDHFAKQYVMSRRLPLWTHDYLMYSNNFRRHFDNFAPLVDSYLPEDARLIIPFYNEWGELQCIQGRALGASKLRYITLKSSIDSTKVFGLDRVDKSKTILVVEGPIDSLFLPNCIATADADLMSAGIGDIFIPDAQYRNRQICQRIEQMINVGKRVVLFPESFQHKDINDAVKDGGMKPMDLMRLIANNCHQGLAAKLVFSKLRKDTKHAKFDKPSNSIYSNIKLGA